MVTASNQDKFLEVLPLLLQHGSDAVTPQMLCSLLQTSSSVNQALRQARARCSVDSHMQRALTTAAGLSSFCVWLKGHSGLVSDLRLRTSEGSSSDDMEALHNVLLLALQLMHACTAVPVPGQAAALPLQLQSFGVQGYRVSPALLAALAATQVQKLAVDLDSRRLTPALGSALGGLHSLRCLAVKWRGTGSLSAQHAATGARFQQLLAGIGQLQGLTRLTLSPAHPAGLQQLPASLQSLELQRCWAPERANTADLQHLTALQALSVQPVTNNVQLQLQLPTQLSSLTMKGGARLGGRRMPCMVSVELSRVTHHVADMLGDLGSQQDRPWRLEFALTNAAGRWISTQAQPWLPAPASQASSLVTLQYQPTCLGPSTSLRCASCGGCKLSPTRRTSRTGSC